MRIPIYRSRAQRPSDAPGRPITARMRAEPFVQAELERGGVIGQALGQVQEYALMRHKAAVEVQMSESLLAAEEEMATLARSLQDSPDAYNVFKPDGSGTWSQNVTEMRDRLADSIESRSARNEFNARFNQRELALRFKLQDEIDKRMKARQAAAAAAEMQALEDRLSNPFTADPVEYEMAVRGMRADQDLRIKNGSVNAESAGLANAQLAANIANRTTMAYVFNDPTRALALADALDLQDEVAAGTIRPEDAYSRSGLSYDAGYTLYTLQALPREQALEIIYDTLGKSTRLYEAETKRREEQDKQFDKQHDNNYRAMFFFSDTGRGYTASDVINMAPGVATMAGFTSTPDAQLTSEQVRDAFMSYFNTFNYLTPEQRKQIDGAFNRPPRSAFSDQRNQDVYADLFRRAEAGNLTIAGLNSQSNFIKAEDYTTLLNKIGAEADDALNDAKSVVKLRFGYDERMAVDTDGAKQAQAAYFSVASQLEQMATQRRAEGNPMTRTEMNAEAQRLANEQLDLFRMALRGDRDQYIEFSMTSIPGIGYENPLADLEAWWTSLTAAEQQQSRSEYARHKFTLLDYQNRMNR